MKKLYTFLVVMLAPIFFSTANDDKVKEGNYTPSYTDLTINNISSDTVCIDEQQDVNADSLKMKINNFLIEWQTEYNKFTTQEKKIIKAMVKKIFVKNHFLSFRNFDWIKSAI